MAKIFKPRRGKKSTMAGTKKTTVLSAGEMFIEVPDTGVGKGHSKMKIGDGSTQYSSLPYAMGDTENDKIAFSNDTSGNITTALNKVTSGAALKTMIAALKQAVSLANTSITQLNDETNNINIYVGEDGKLHFVDKDGADTVLNFSSLTLDFSTMKLYNTSAAMNDSYTAFHTYFVLPKENIESIAFTAENLSDTFENDTFVAAGNVFISSVNSMDLLLQNGCILCYPGYDTGTIKNKTVINRNGSYSFNDFSDCLNYICFGMGFWNWYGNWRFDIKDIEIKMK